MTRIIDCFTFYNELDLLKYRLDLLDDVVDFFVIVESTHTFVGKEKRLFFNENKHLIDNEKIIHIIVDDFPYKHPDVRNNADIWKNENFQRNAIQRGIDLLKDLSDEDVVIVSDLDEIPDPHTLGKIKRGEIIVGFHALQMDLYYYNLNTRFKSKWTSSKIISYKKYKELNINCNDIRMTNCGEEILNGGWHLSYFGDKHFIQNKIQNFAHQEFNNSEYTELDKIEERINNAKDLYGREYADMSYVKIEDNKYLPKDYQKLIGFYKSTTSP